MQLPGQLQLALGSTDRIERELGQGAMATVEPTTHDRRPMTFLSSERAADVWVAEAERK